ncbi:hypothetical protein CDL12_25321 [Handroanthus impetiginosus]|uniref:RING-type E3 ubiquitin transferase n=1 Tax=Handroanthus impetiginosus TaxID=429701 RepID=A0A2G9GA33_9LAMI|nr:hypothetical protein CDL12_25321 [Handroanthus impetiginosus]
MDILKLPFFLFLFSSLVHCKKHCPTSYCGNNNNLPIHYPFKLQEQQLQNCSYINLRCSTQGVPILNLWYSGDFYVRHIDYESSIIQLYDPENCLPKQLMNLNLSSLDPFVVVLTKNYTFSSCPSELIELSSLTSIDCLSNSSSATVATHKISSQVMKKLYKCNEIITSLVTVLGLHSYDFIGNQSDFFLMWIKTSCQDCPKAKGLVPESIFGVAFIMISPITIILPAVICLACCAHVTKMVREEGRGNNSVIA